MLIHKECHGHVVIPIEGLRIAVENFGISTKEKNIILNQITIIDEKPGRKTADISFYCCECHKNNIDLDEILIQCGNCGEVVELKDLFILPQSGGVYCIKCKKKIIGRTNGVEDSSFVNILPYFKKKIQL